MRAKVLVSIAGIALAACGRDPLQQAPASALSAAEGDSLRIRSGQTAEVGPQRLRIHFREIADDSRCPRGVQCVWQGDAVAVLSLSYPGEAAAPGELHTGQDPGRLMHGRHLVELLEVEPYPTYGAPPIGAREYVVVLRVTRP